jgi:hypothetical protein
MLSNSMVYVLKGVFGFSNAMISSKGGEVLVLRGSRLHQAAKELASHDLVTLRPAGELKEVWVVSPAKKEVKTNEPA